MKNIVKTFGLFSVITAVFAANAATSRVSVTSKASSRLPSIAGYVKGVGIVTGTSTTSSTTSTTSLLTNAECIDTYTGCLKGADACGSGFEECTTNVLLHAKMPSCLSVLSQCSASGINDLFGTSSVTALTNVESKNAYGEITKFTYPTDGSVLGQMVLGAKISNMLTTDQCVKKYMNCLHKDSVCGNDFELCTTNTEFRKQSVYCASTLARCQGDGLTELFGSTSTSSNPSGRSRLGQAISEGASLAAVNAVSTCYKVADQCILNACGANPNRCIAESNGTLARIADAINGGNLVSSEDLMSLTSNVTSADVNGYIKGSCLDTIGGNKYCYATFIGNGAMPTNAQLRDEDNREEVFNEAVATRMGSNSAIRQRLKDLANKFDTKTKDKCVATIKSCAMRSCGNGLGSVCYSQVFGQDGENTINGKATYQTIKTACESVVNTDPNCQYAAASVKNDLYTYTYTDNSVFTTLFPEYESGGSDPISVVGALNSSLSSSYNNAALAKMKKQCSNTAVGCVKSLCGTDYTNCYRNRTDVMSNTYDTGSTKFDKSMNKVGGVLDYNIVTGLCLNQVKNADVCDEHLKIEAFKLKAGQLTGDASWGDSVRGDWIDAAKSIKVTNMPEEVVVGCKTASVGCDVNTVEACEYVDEDGCVYDQPVTETWDEYSISNAAKNLFQQILMDIEKEVQAKYNAKLTHEQNVCLGNNIGGIRGVKDNGSTFMWVKLKSNRVPKNYPMKGLNVNQFTASNDLYGSFCRAKITVVSDDKYIQDYLKDANTTAYFAVGDTFTCGSWIEQKTLDTISEKVAEKAAKDAGKDSKKDMWTRAWWTLGGTLLGGVGAYAGMDAIQRNGSTLGGLINPNKDEQVAKNTRTAAASCRENVELAKKALTQADAESDDKAFIEKSSTAAKVANRALDNANTIKKEQGDSIKGLNLKSGMFRAAAMKTRTETVRQNNLDVGSSNIGNYKLTNPLFLNGSTPDFSVTGKKPTTTFGQYVANQRASSTTGNTICEWNVGDREKAQTARDAIVNAGKNSGCKLQSAKTNDGKHNCSDAIIDVDILLGSAVTEGLANQVMAKLNEAKNACNTGNAKGAQPCANVVVPSDLLVICKTEQPIVDNTDPDVVVDNTDPDAITGGTTGSTGGNTTTTTTYNANGSITQTTTYLDRDAYVAEFTSNIDIIDNYCANHEDVEENNKHRRNLNLVAGTVGAVGGGILAYKIVQSAQEIKYEEAENKAVQEWMDEVGSHIKCYLGGDELGEFGDTIYFELD